MSRFITSEKILEIFKYGKLKKLVGQSSPNGPFPTLGNNFEWKSDGYYYKGYKDIPPAQIPPHIYWFNNPYFAFVGLIDNQIEYRYGSGGPDQSSYNTCPITKDEKQIDDINKIFEFWYRELDLPKSLQVTKKQKSNRSDPMKLIEDYVADGSSKKYDLLCEKNDVTFAVDWREEDHNIINYCENVLHTGHLKGEMIDAKNERGFDVLVTYKNKTTTVQYPNKDRSDRDSTLIELNELLKPDYEIRWCLESNESDTLVFLPLAQSQWGMLTKKFGEKNLNKLFRTINKKSVMFG